MRAIYRLMTVVVFLAGCGMAWTVNADVLETREFADETLRLRYLDLIDELRCPKCQNQNLADSNSAIAIDLRNQVYRMLDEGKSDREIVDYLVTRYGDFVRYRPPLKSTTWLLWGTPVLLVLLIVAGVLVVRKQRKPQPDVSAELSLEEQQRLEVLLKSSGSGDEEPQTGRRDSSE